MEAHREIALLSTRGRRIDETGRVLGPQADHFRPGIYAGEQAICAWFWFYAHYAYNPLNYPSGMLMRREICEKTGLFDDSMVGADDIGYYLRMLEHGDLAVVDALGCDIGVHGEQASIEIWESGDFVRWTFALTRMYCPELERKGYFKRVMRQFAAISLAQAIKFRVAGKVQASRTHLELAHSSGFGLGSISVGLLRILGFRLLLKLAGKRNTGVRPVKSL